MFAYIYLHNRQHGNVYLFDHPVPSAVYKQLLFVQSFSVFSAEQVRTAVEFDLTGNF